MRRTLLWEIVYNPPFLDAIASPSSYPCQSVGGSVSESVSGAFSKSVSDSASQSVSQ